jgi:hypothetical protein
MEFLNKGIKIPGNTDKTSPPLIIAVNGQEGAPKFFLFFLFLVLTPDHKCILSDLISLTLSNRTFHQTLSLTTLHIL